MTTCLWNAAAGITSVPGNSFHPAGIPISTPALPPLHRTHRVLKSLLQTGNARSTNLSSEYDTQTQWGAHAVQSILQNPKVVPMLVYPNSHNRGTERKCGPSAGSADWSETHWSTLLKVWKATIWKYPQTPNNAVGCDTQSVTLTIWWASLYFKHWLTNH